MPEDPTDPDPHSEPDADYEPEIEYEEAPEVIALSGDEPGPDAVTLAQITWLLRRYTSHRYISRLRDLLAGLADVFLRASLEEDEISPATAAEWARTLHDRITALQGVLDHLERGKPAQGYGLLEQAIAGLEPLDARDELHFSLRAMTQVLGEDAQPWGERAGAMAQRIAWTLAGCWCSETVLADRPSLRTRPMRLPTDLPRWREPAADALRVKTGQKVPQTGLWVPATIRNACPNFLIEGRRAPELRRACERLDYAATSAGGGEPAREAWSDFEYTDEPTEWRLVQVDARYRGGAIADEDALLDEDNAVPASPPRR